MGELTMLAQCPCGETEIELAGSPIWQVYCHCDDCQRAHGAAYVARAVFERDAVTIKNGTIRSWINRTRSMVICSNCGSHLYGEHDNSPYRGVNASLLPKGSFKPVAHLQCQYAVAPVSDELPHYRDFPTEWGGSGLRMDW